MRQKMQKFNEKTLNRLWILSHFDWIFADCEIQNYIIFGKYLRVMFLQPSYMK